MSSNVGFVFNYHRLRQSFKLEYISYISGISVSKISKFENGKIELKNEELNLLFHALNLEFNNEERIQEEFLKEADNFLVSIFFCNKLKEGWEKLKKYEENIVTSNVFPIYILNEFAFYVFSVQLNAMFELKETVEHFYPCYTKEYKQLYHDVIGVYYFYKNKFEDSVLYLNKGIKYNYSDKIMAYLFYHLSLSYKRIGKISLSLEYASKANSIFKTYVNVKRISDANMIISLLHTSLGHYDYAEILYKNSILSFQNLRNDDSLAHTYSNLIWNYVLSHQYQKAIHYYLENKNYIQEQGSVYFSLFFSYFKLGEYENAKKYLKKAKDNLKDESKFVVQAVSTFSTVLSNNKSNNLKEQKLENLYLIAKKSHVVNNQMFLIDYLLEYFTKKNQLEKIVFYQNEMIEILKKRNQE